jgi:hypothetical protein
LLEALATKYVGHFALFGSIGGKRITYRELTGHEPITTQT